MLRREEERSACAARKLPRTARGSPNAARMRGKFLDARALAKGLRGARLLGLVHSSLLARRARLLRVAHLVDLFWAFRDL